MGILNKIEPASTPPRFRVLGVPVDAVQIPETIARIEQWISARDRSHLVAVTGMHGVMEAQRTPSFRTILKNADMVVADGMPLVWLGRRHGLPMRRRVYGPELMETFCRDTGPLYRHFFYGGADGVADLLGSTMRRKYSIRVAGGYSPPFRPLTPEERKKITQTIRAVSPDILWVGLSTPKQERWMWEQRQILDVPVMVGVGAAFDFATGRVKQAPSWMREHGLECVFRLSREPRRLWRRYIIYGSGFVWNVSLELLHLKTFN